MTNLEHLMRPLVGELKEAGYVVINATYNVSLQRGEIEVVERKALDFGELRTKGYNPVRREIKAGITTILLYIDLTMRSKQNGRSNRKTKTQNPSEPVRDTAKGRQTRTLPNQRQDARENGASDDQRRPRRKRSRQTQDKTPGEQNALRKISDN